MIIRSNFRAFPITTDPTALIWAEIAGETAAAQDEAAGTKTPRHSIMVGIATGVGIWVVTRFLEKVFPK